MDAVVFRNHHPILKVVRKEIAKILEFQPPTKYGT